MKDNTGYDLPSLLCGSEGTLGIVTAARLRLVAAATTERVVALVAFARCRRGAWPRWPPAPAVLERSRRPS